MIREIKYYGASVLRKKAKKVKDINEDILTLIKDMKETMKEFNGIGLAAPQIDVSVRVIIVEKDEPLALINPRIIREEGEVESYEGCLSLPLLYGTVIRPKKVVVSAINENGEDVYMEEEGKIAHCLSHEIDHLNGQLFIDLKPDPLYWVVPDTNSDNGYILRPTTINEAKKSLKKLKNNSK